ncbi:hypothetical protein ACWERF_05870 [Streptomyces griseoluteus]|uniref:hypothetical protein n=1 Tax=Streptomyces griseoluteus TaxID=29306 RepID=UPI00380B3718
MLLVRKVDLTEEAVTHAGRGHSRSVRGESGRGVREGVRPRPAAWAVTLLGGAHEHA